MEYENLRNGIAVAHYFESCKLEAYPDPDSSDGKPWTIGWGHTGPEVFNGLKWTQKQADDAFVIDIAKFERGVEARAKSPVNQGQFDALVVFAYNVGFGDKRRGIQGLETSTLLAKLNAGDYAGVPSEFPKWNKNDGKVMRGLIRRRAAEAALFAGKSGAEAIAIGVKAA